MFTIGTRVHCILYGGRDGIVYAIEGRQTPETVHSLMGGAMVTGGSANLSIVFEDGTKSVVPECIVMGVQWHKLPGEATEQEIAEALAHCERETARRKAEKEAAEARRAAEREQHARENPHLLKKSDRPDWSPAKLAAENIRRELKRAFPKIKFSVTTRGYNCVNVNWDNGPTSSAVKAITDKYRAGDFDGMQDLYVSDPDLTFGDVFGDPRYVFPTRFDTVEGVREAWVRAGFDGAEVGPKWYDTERYQHIRRAWAETDLTEWTVAQAKKAKSATV